MARIALLGNAAGGKSTLARHLSQTRRLPHVEIDALYWRPDWIHMPNEIYTATHTAEIAKDRWIIDGGGHMPSIKARLLRATQIILIDLPLWRHFHQAAERQIAWATGTLRHPPGNAASMPPTERLFEMIWQYDRDVMPDLRNLCRAQEAAGKKVIRLTTPEGLEAFNRDG